MPFQKELIQRIDDFGIDDEFSFGIEGIIDQGSVDIECT
jgi:hypothetical protein